MANRRITTFCSWLRQRTDDPIQGSRKYYEMAVSDRIPGAHQINGIWHFRDEDETEILRSLGLTPKRSTRSERLSASEAIAA